MPTTLKRANVKVKVNGQFQDLGLLQSDIATQLASEIATRQSNDNSLEANKIPYPLNPNSKYGNPGDVLRTDGGGGTKWVPIGQPTDEQTQTAINNWLDEHPEATTTVQDGSLTEAKFTDELKLKSIKDYVTPQMYGAKADGTTDDSSAFQSAVNSGKLVYVPNGKYKLNSQIELKAGTFISGGGSAGDYEYNLGGFRNTILNFDGSGFLIKGSHVVIKNLRINGAGTGNGIATETTEYSASEGEVSKIIIENMFINNFETGINMRCYLSNFSMINIYNCTNAFRLLQGTSQKLYGCYSAMCDYGFILGSVYSTLINCACDQAEECCYQFTQNAKNICCVSLGAEQFKKKLIYIKGSYNINFDGVMFFSKVCTDTEGIIKLQNARYTYMRNVEDRLLDYDTSVTKYFYVHYGFNNKIEMSNIINQPTKIDLSSGINSRGKFIVEFNPVPADNAEGSSTFLIGENDFVNTIVPNMYSYQYDGNIVFKINDLDGDFKINSAQSLVYINRAKKIIITTDDLSKNIFDTGAMWWNISVCNTVIEFRDLSFIPKIYGDYSRPFFKIGDAHVIFKNCDFTQPMETGYRDTRIHLLGGTTIVFDNCVVPSTTEALYTVPSNAAARAKTNVIIGLT